MRVGIIGTGAVGSSVAISALHAGVANELLLSDAREARAEGEAMDLAHGAAFYPAASVSTASVEEMMETDAVVIAAGRGGGPEESRLDLLRDNAGILRDIGSRLGGYGGIVVVVTNPVDVLTYVLAESSGISPERVIGTGTMLDTARLRQVLGRELRLDPHSVHAQVLGEHGDSEVIIWSGAHVGGTPLREWPGWDTAQEERVAEEVRSAAYRIVQRKGATNHAIGLVTAALLRWSLRGERLVLTVSRVQHG
ncbi:MAG: L-lactate dehydrogenase, partial [Gemmatimonadetes bacterium]|nr:L-lactate dehydrogenase [Gemmatimonadota bacterium]